MFCASLNRFVQHKSCTLGMCMSCCLLTPYRSNVPTWFAVKANDTPGPNCPASCRDKLAPTWCEMRAQVSLTHLYTQIQFNETSNLEVKMNEGIVPYLTIMIKPNWTVKRTEQLMAMHNKKNWCTAGDKSSWMMTHMVTGKDDVNMGQYPAVCASGVTYVSVGIHTLWSKNDALKK